MTRQKGNKILEIGKLGLALILAASILVAAIVAFFVLRDREEIPVQIPPEDVVVELVWNEAFDFVRALGVGWNLGNTLDSLDNQRRGIVGNLPHGVTAEVFYETLWGNPVTTPEMMASITGKGFGAVRVPVTWTDHLYDDFSIRADWLARVEQVVNYVIDSGMHVIINVHHDNGSGSWPWLRADMDNIEWMEERFATLWAQIAEHFKYYDNRLIFEGFNEILDADSNWTGSSRASHEAVNRLNQVFVDTVRASGGNNSNRFLLVKTYGARRYEAPVRDFVLPNDIVDYRLIVGVHFYGTHGFVRQQEDIPWTTSYSVWDYERNGGQAREVIALLRDNFINNGIPVIIVEFGATNKDNTSDRIRYAVHYIETAGRYGIACFWWDDGGRAERAEDVRNYALFNRNNNEWHFPEIASALVAAAR